MFVAWFNAIPDQNLAISAGGKGASLCRMHRNGFPVPEGFVVTSEAFCEFMESNGLWDKVFTLIDGINWDNTSALEEQAEVIRRLLVESPMPEEIEKTILEYYQEMDPSSPVAVRSSGTAEDLDDASFAGQQETYLYVIGKEQVVRYVKECWASLYNDRALFYRRQKKFDERSIAIAVVVQRMVNSDKAGVMFSANPITNNRDEVMIEAAWGLGEGVVQGIVTPDSYTISKSNSEMLAEIVSCKEIMVVRQDEHGGVKEAEVPSYKQESLVLSLQERLALVDMAVRIENFYGKPQDLEWAYEGDKLYMLQSRPITTL